jgi:hypothetical protein
MYRDYAGLPANAQFEGQTPIGGFGQPQVQQPAPVMPRPVMPRPTMTRPSSIGAGLAALRGRR